jgi:hypothetical protein
VGEAIHPGVELAERQAMVLENHREVIRTIPRVAGQQGANVHDRPSISPQDGRRPTGQLLCYGDARTL